MCRVTLRFLVTCVCALSLTKAESCEPNPCHNGGVCQPHNGGYNWGFNCICMQGFIGAQCEWDGLECDNDTLTPCVNGGECVLWQDGRFCLCPGTSDTSIAFGGHYCEMENPCASCPEETVYCQTGINSLQGRVCLDEGHRMIVDGI